MAPRIGTGGGNPLPMEPRCEAGLAQGRLSTMDRAKSRAYPQRRRGCPPATVVVNALPSPPRFLAAALVLLAGCEQVEKALDARRELTPHEAYIAALRATGLEGSALARDWIREADAALEAPLPVPLPHREEGFLAADAPAAVGLRLALRRGQVLTVKTTFDAGDPARVFLDLFRVPDRPGDPLRPLVRVDSLPNGMVYEPYRDGDYVLRLQPELLRSGRYVLSLSLDPSLSFPVDGMDGAAIGSSFGDPRDGGARLHHGVDIFAPRGTPALAASPGRVTRVQDTSRGGLVVWVRDEKRGQNLYYAHLSRQLVNRGMMVSTGDTIGLVGNTGNARSTPPHLHFGVYARGPQDPTPYLAQPRGVMPRLPAAPEKLGSWSRVTTDGVPLLTQPGARADPLVRLPRDTPVRLIAGSGSWWRVRLPDARVGWLPTTATEPAESSLRETMLTARTGVLSEPTPEAPLMAPLEPGSKLSVLGEFSNYLWVRGPDGRPGWVPTGG